MRLARPLLRVPGIACAALLIVLSGLSAWGLMSVFSGYARGLVTQAVELYDSTFPEITISSGHASIRGHQPYIKDFSDEKEAQSPSVIIVIDTREGKQSEAIGRLKDVREGIVLTRDALAVKNSKQTRILPLKDFPDFVVNSQTLKEFSDTNFSTVVSVIAMAVLTYFLVAKLLHALLLALIAWLGARAHSVPFRYSQALKLGIPALTPAVLVDAATNLLGVQIPVFFVLYFALMMGSMVLLTRDLITSSSPSAVPAGGHDPS